MIQTVANDQEDGFDLNQIQSQVLMTGAHGDWARFAVSSIGTATSFGSAVVILEGSLNPSGANDEGWFEVNSSVKLTAFGISGIINVTGIPSLRIRVMTAQGSAATYARARLTVASSRT